MLRKLCLKPLLGILSPDPMFIYGEGKAAAIQANLSGFVSAHNISKVLVELFHRAVRGSVLLKHSGHALCCRSITRHGSVNIKVLIKLFQKFAGSRGRALAALRRVRNSPAKELRGGESDKTIRWIVFRRGEPCDRGRP